MAQDKKPEKKKDRPVLTEKQKQLRKDLLAKYDANKDGKLDREERKKFSDADKAKLKKARDGQNANGRKAGKKHLKNSSTHAERNSAPVKTQ
jgi:hypothetical protein